MAEVELFSAVGGFAPARPHALHSASVDVYTCTCATLQLYAYGLGSCIAGFHANRWGALLQLELSLPEFYQVGV